MDLSPYRATLYPWLPACFVVVSIVVVGAGVYRGAVGDEAMTAESLYPLMGLVIFAGTWLGYRWGLSPEDGRSSQS